MKTTPTKKVLIAVDYSDTAKEVAEKGYSIAKALNAQVILLHVIAEQPIYYTGYSYMREMQIEISPDIRKSTEDFLERMKKHLGDKFIQTIVKDCVDVGSSIVHVAETIDADMIVLGSHSRKWLENIIMGSEVEEVLRKTTIPLYIIPTKKHK